jgi:hypothetical protein
MRHALRSHLDNSDHLELLNLSRRSVTCADYRDLKSLVADLNNLFSFDNAVCAQSNLLDLIKPNNHIPDIDVCDVSYPDGYLDLYFDKQFYFTDAVTYQYLKYCQFVVINGSSRF